MKPKHKSISVLCLVILISVGLIASLDQAMAQPFAYVGEIGFSRVLGDRYRYEHGRCHRAGRDSTYWDSDHA